MNNKSPSDQYKRLVSDILIFIIGIVLTKAIQFLLMPLYTSYMTSEAYGIAELTNNLAELFFPIATLCIHEAAFRFAVDPDFEENGIVAAVIRVLAVSLCIGFFTAFISKLFFGYQYAFYLFFILYAYSIRMCAAYYVRGIGLSKIFAVSGVVNAIALGTFNVIFLIILKDEINGYLISIGLSYCVSAIYLLLKSRIVININFCVKTKNYLKILIEYSVPLIFYNVLYWFTTISGRYILMWFTDPSTVGRYVAAIKISAVINMIQQAVYAAFQLNSARMYIEKDKETYYSGVINVFISLYCTFGALIVCLTPILAKATLKNEFYSANCFLPVIMLSALINCISSLLGTMYSAYKKTQRMVAVSVIGAAINVGVGVILTPMCGIWGICIASICCSLSQTIYKFIDIAKFCKINYNWRLVISNMLLLSVIVIVMSTDISNKIIVSFCLLLILLFANQKFILMALDMLVNKKQIQG